MRKHPDQWTIGQLDDALKAIRRDDAPVVFDFAGVSPVDFASYRGYYEDAALSFAIDGDITVGQLRERIRARYGDVMTGYKGGDYRVTPDTALWAATWGRTGDTVVSGLLDRGYLVVIQTTYSEDD